MITLNSGQQSAYNALVDYLVGSDSCMYLLKGYAGTGKTFTLGRVLEGALELRNLRVAVSAPTHKAVQVLKKSQSLGGRVDYATIHSLLGLKEEIDHKTGKINFVPTWGDRDPRIEAYNVLILDEVSMLSTELFTLLMKARAKMSRLHIIMMGDPVQIPPVESGKDKPSNWCPDSPVFLADKQEAYDIRVLELTDIVRQGAGNPILEYATTLRQEYKKSRPVASTALTTDGRGIEVIDVETPQAQTRIGDILQEYFCDGQFQENSDHMKVVAYTNKVVNFYNQAIRERIYGKSGKDLPHVVNGEKMIADKPYFDNQERMLLSTNQEFEVVSHSVDFMHVPWNKAKGMEMSVDMTMFQYYQCLISTEVILPGGIATRKEHEIKILHEDSLGEWDRLANEHKQLTLKTYDQDARKRGWRQYYNNLGLFCWFKYNYAITAHKSQGSTYDNVLMLDWDISRNHKLEEMNRIKYVAATRARNRLFIAKV